MALSGFFNLNKNKDKRSPSRSSAPSRYNSLNDLDTDENFMDEQDPLIQKMLASLDPDELAIFKKRAAISRPFSTAGPYPDHARSAPPTPKLKIKSEWDQFSQKYEAAAKNNFSLNPQSASVSVKNEPAFSTPIITSAAIRSPNFSSTLTTSMHQENIFAFPNTLNTYTTTQMPPQFSQSTPLHTGAIPKHSTYGIPLSSNVTRPTFVPVPGNTQFNTHNNHATYPRTSTQNILACMPHFDMQGNTYTHGQQGNENSFIPISHTHNTHIINPSHQATTPTHAISNQTIPNFNTAFTPISTFSHNNINYNQNTTSDRNAKISWDVNTAQPHFYTPEYSPESQFTNINNHPVCGSGNNHDYLNTTQNIIHNARETQQNPTENLNFNNDNFLIHSNTHTQDQNCNSCNAQQNRTQTNNSQFICNPLTDQFQRSRGLTFSQALNLIPNFNGSPENLNMFCMAVRQVCSNFGPGADKFVFMALASKLSGKAADSFAARLLSYSSVHDFLADIVLQYSNIGLADEIMSQLKVITQKPGEKAGDYGIRTQKLLNQLITIYESAPNIERWDREYRKHIANNEALQHFTFGLASPLNCQVRCDHPKSLGEAIRIAIEYECKQNARLVLSQDKGYITTPKANINFATTKPAVTQNNAENNISPNIEQKDKEANSFTCNYCGAKGHLVPACEKRRKEKGVCNFCGRIGHTIDVCRTKEYQLGVNRNSNNYNQGNANDFNNGGRNNNNGNNNGYGNRNNDGNNNFNRNNGRYNGYNNNNRNQFNQRNNQNPGNEYFNRNRDVRDGNTSGNNNNNRNFNNTRPDDRRPDNQNNSLN